MMFGNIMNNKQIIDAVDSGCIKISSFDPDKLRLIHYPLTPGKILDKSTEAPDGNFRTPIKRDCSGDNEKPCFLVPNEFVIIEVAEHVSLRESIVGHIIPASIMARKGLALIAGRIEAPFGEFSKKKQFLQFGVKNLTDKPARLDDDETIAYIYFIDLRGLDKASVMLTAEEIQKFTLWSQRRLRAQDDGVDYGTGS
jgi:deoxycytidine triphosphate deaminase